MGGKGRRRKKEEREECRPSRERGREREDDIKAVRREEREKEEERTCVKKCGAGFFLFLFFPRDFLRGKRVLRRWWCTVDFLFAVPFPSSSIFGLCGWMLEIFSLFYF